MAEEQEYKKVDSDSGWWANNARLMKDPEIKETAGGTIVRLTFISTSRNEGTNGVVKLWVEVTPDQYCTEPAKFLKAKDEIARIEGHEEMRTFGDNKERYAFSIKFARLKFSSALKATLRERGWDPSKKTDGAKPAETKRTTRRRVQELPE